MTASRHASIASLLTVTLFVMLLAAPTLAGERTVVLDGGKSWAVEGSGDDASALVPLPMPDAEVFLSKSVEMSQGQLATGVEMTERDGQGVEKLLVMRANGSEIERLPTPKQQHDAVTYAPTPVMKNGELAGMMWIEGFAPNQTRVMTSDWTGAGWSQPVAVSAFGPGTQIALDVVRLGDGSLLAAWAAFDGEDDEIVWSRRQADGSWSKPSPLTENAVPDVTPSLLATKSGAVVAWSGYDGNDYRIQLASLDLESESWSAPTLLEGRGGVSPEFQKATGKQGSGDAAVLTWRQAAPRTWMVGALDGETLLWTSPAPQPPAQLRGRPMAEMSKDGSVQLRWPIASADGVAKTDGGANPDGGAVTVLGQTVVQPPEG